DVRELGPSHVAGHRKRPQPAFLDEREKDRLGGHADLNLAAQQIRNRGRRAFVWNEDDIAGGSDPEQLEADMRTNADGGARCELAPISLALFRALFHPFRPYPPIG